MKLLIRYQEREKKEKIKGNHVTTILRLNYKFYNELINTRQSGLFVFIKNSSGKLKEKFLITYIVTIFIKFCIILMTQINYIY
jgi:hypothetical protein